MNPMLPYPQSILSHPFLREGKYLLLRFSVFLLIVLLSVSPNFFSSPKLILPRLSTDFANLPLSFIPNVGQSQQKIRFQTQGMGSAIFFAQTEIALSLPTSDSHSAKVVRLRYENANQAVSIAGTNPLPGIVNYILGNDPKHWQTNIPTYSGISYEKLYPGIDLSYQGTEGKLKSTYHVAPGADPTQIKWHYEGINAAKIDEKTGNLHLTSANSHEKEIIEYAPVAWQIINGERVAVAIRYVLIEKQNVFFQKSLLSSEIPSIGFVLENYNSAYLLTIDPVLAYSTFLGGSQADTGYSIAIDSAGSAYFAGETKSSDFPVANALNKQIGDSDQGGDAFVIKLNPAGNTLLYSTFIGGKKYDRAFGIAVDSSGNAYLTGDTNSDNFPLVNSLDKSLSTVGSDAFVLKLDQTGANLLYSTFLGGNGGDIGYGITVDRSDNAYITGETVSLDFPTTQNAFLATKTTSDNDVFITKINESGSTLVYSTFLKGTGDDSGRDIALDSSDNVYVTGSTQSKDFSTTTAVVSNTLAGLQDGFITKLSADGSKLLYSSYLGGSGVEVGYGVAVDSVGSIFVTGQTNSTDFPTTPNAFSSKKTTTDNDAFVLKIDPNSKTPLFSTYLGGSNADSGDGIALDNNGNIFVAGETRSTNFPLLKGISSNLALKGNTDAFLTKLNSSGDKLIFSTFLGGDGDDTANDVAVDGLGRAYLIGASSSTSNFPLLNPLQTTNKGDRDLFLAKIVVPSICISNVSVKEGNSGTTNMDFTVTLSDKVNENVTVDYVTQDKTALAGIDYLAVPTTTLTFAPNEIQKTVTIKVYGDLLEEPNEDLLVKLGNSSSNVEFTSGCNVGVGTIENDDSAKISISDAQPIKEGLNGQKALTFTVSLTPKSVFDLQIDYQTVDNTAKSPSDYQTQAGTLLFRAGESTKIITITVFGDSENENDEQFFIDLSNPRTTNGLQEQLGKGRGIGIIIDGNGSNLSILDAQPLLEGNSGSTNAVFTATLSRQSLITVTADFATKDGTASNAGNDYTSVSGKVIIPPGKITKTIEVAVKGNLQAQFDRQFFVNLSNPQNATLVRDQAIGTILDDDGPDIQFNSERFQVREDEISATISIKLSNPSPRAILVNYATSDKSAIAGVDYIAERGILRFEPGTVITTFVVPLLDNKNYEGLRELNLTLSNPAAGATLGNLKEAILAISDNERTPDANAKGQIRFISPTYSVKENDGQATIIVERINGSGIVNVRYDSFDQTAVGGRDYVQQSGTITFNSSERKSFKIPIIDNKESDGDKTVSLTLNNVTGGATLDEPSVANLNIIDDDATAKSIVFFGSPNYNVVESDGFATIVVSRTGNLSQTMSVDYAISDNTAIAGNDYQTKRGTLRFGLGQATQTFTITIVNDSLIEGYEIANLTLLNPTNGAILGTRSTAELTIIDDDFDSKGRGTIRFSSPSYFVSENGTFATLVVKRIGGNTGAITVQYNTFDGTAIAGRDYTAVISGLLTFASGETLQNITIPILDNKEIDGNRYLNLVLSNITGGAILGTQDTVTLTIVDDDAASANIAIIAFDSPKYQVNEGIGNALITVKRTGNLSNTVTVRYTTIDETALANGDYLASSGVLTFSVNEASKTFLVSIVDDSVAEGEEQLQLALNDVSVGGMLGAQRMTTLVIVDNDEISSNKSVFYFSSPKYEVYESVGKALITVYRTGNTTSEEIVHYATSDGTAIAAKNYLPISGTLTFGKGIASQTFSVPIIEDQVAEGDKNLFLALSNPAANAILGTQSSAMLTIIDNDQHSEGVIFFGNPVYRVNEAGKSAIITVKRTGGTTGSVKVDYTTSDGTALAEKDYTATSGTLVFNNGIVAQTFSIPILDDSLVEGAENINLTLKNVGGGALLGLQAKAQLIIDDDDDDKVASGVVQFDFEDYRVVENAGSITVTVRRTGGVKGTITVEYVTSDDTAKAGKDYRLTQGILTLAEGISFQTFSIPILDDQIREAEEKFKLILRNPTNGSQLGTLSSVTIVIEDDDPLPCVQFSSSYYAGKTIKGIAPITVTLNPASEENVQVQFTTRDITTTLANEFVAQAGKDYVSNSGILSFTQKTTQLFSITLLPNAQKAKKTLSLQLSQPLSATLCKPMSATLTLEELGRSEVYLPLILAPQPLPDLVGSFQLTPAQPRAGEQVLVTVTITNQGKVAATGFWTDFYINPAKRITGPNTRWDEVCSLKPCFGLAWYVDSLQAGASITLQSVAKDYSAKYTNWQGYFIKGTNDLFLFVDSWNRLEDAKPGEGVPTGGVVETNETNNGTETLLDVQGTFNVPFLHQKTPFMQARSLLTESK